MPRRPPRSPLFPTTPLFRSVFRRPDRGGPRFVPPLRRAPPRILANRHDGAAGRPFGRAARAPPHPVDARLPRGAWIHGAVREHDLFPAANVRTATHVVDRKSVV